MSGEITTEIQSLILMDQRTRDGTESIFTSIADLTLESTPEAYQLAAKYFKAVEILQSLWRLVTTPEISGVTVLLTPYLKRKI